MAATGIMMLVMSMVLYLTNNVLSSWNRSTTQLESNFEARVAMDLLTSDLQSMVVRDRGVTWLEVEYKDDSVGQIPNSFKPPVLYLYASAMERPREDDGQNTIEGSICAISYRLDYQNPFTGNTSAGEQPYPTYGLYRSVIDSENTFSGPLAMANYDGTEKTRLSGFWEGEGQEDTNNDGIPDNGIDRTTYDEVGGIVNDAGFDSWITSSKNFLSQNVVRFELQFFTQVGNAAPTAIPEQVGFVYTGNGIYDDNGNTIDGKLVYVDVRMTIVDKEGAQKLISGSDYGDVIRQYGQVFSRRINLMSSPF